MEGLTTQFVELIKDISLPGALIVVVYFLKPLWQALASKINATVGEASLIERLGALEKFRYKAETNHFHDLDSVISDQKETWKAVKDLEGRIIRLETLIGNKEK